MPILDVDKARTVMVIKRNLAAGFAGIDNPLDYLDKTLLLFGDAKNFVGSIVRELTGGRRVASLARASTYSIRLYLSTSSPVWKGWCWHSTNFPSCRLSPPRTINPRTADRVDVSSKFHFQAPGDVALPYSRPASATAIRSQESIFDRPIAWWISLALMLTALLVPILATEVPPLTDYPNHLARCYVLAFGQADPVLSQMFSTHWQIIPNIAVDLLLPALMHVFSPLVAGRIILAFCLLLPAAQWRSVMPIFNDVLSGRSLRDSLPSTRCF
jgi:hypothetical protein